jgi:hypothetical protein
MMSHRQDYVTFSDNDEQIEYGDTPVVYVKARGISVGATMQWPL